MRQAVAAHITAANTAKRWSRDACLIAAAASGACGAAAAGVTAVAAWVGPSIRHVDQELHCKGAGRGGREGWWIQVGHEPVGVARACTCSAARHGSSHQGPPRLGCTFLQDCEKLLGGGEAAWWWDRKVGPRENSAQASPVALEVSASADKRNCGDWEP